MSKYTELFQMLELGDPVEVQVPSRSNYNTICSKLHKINQLNNGIFVEIGEPDMQRSLKTSLKSKELVATFQLVPLGQTHQDMKAKFTIITKLKENAEIQCNLGNPEEE